MSLCTWRLQYKKTIDGVEGGHHRAHSESGAILNTVFENKVRLVNTCVETGTETFLINLYMKQIWTHHVTTF